MHPYSSKVATSCVYTRQLLGNFMLEDERWRILRFGLLGSSDLGLKIWASELVIAVPCLTLSDPYIDRNSIRVF